MKRPTAASLKKVSPENLARLGPERLAGILMAAADTRPDLKRWLRMELAAEQGADHLVLEIDKRLVSLETSRGRISWRKRAAFVADLDVLRGLIAGRLAVLDAGLAREKLYGFLDLARRLSLRVRDKDGEMEAVFEAASADLSGLLATGGDGEALAAAITRYPSGWNGWLPAVLEHAPPDLARVALSHLSRTRAGESGWTAILRRLADAAGDPDAFRATFSREALLTPSVAAEVARRMLEAGRVEDAGRLLEAARPVLSKPRGWFGGRGQAPEPDYEWETVWIEWLDRSGQGEAAQAARWASFERTLSLERAKAFTSRLADFDDVEAEGRAFAYAAAHADADRALRFLIAWPALPEAAQLILARADELNVGAEDAELWAARLRARQPRAAHLLLRKTAAAALRRRDFAASERLTQEADALDAG